MHLENSVTGKNRNIKQMAQASSQGKGEGGGSRGGGEDSPLPDLNKFILPKTEIMLYAFLKLCFKLQA